MSLIEQREWWLKDWEAGGIPFFYDKGFKMSPEKVQEYRENKYNPLWRKSVEHERMCDYLIWKEEKEKC